MLPLLLRNELNRSFLFREIVISSPLQIGPQGRFGLRSRSFIRHHQARIIRAYRRVKNVRSKAERNSLVKMGEYLKLHLGQNVRKAQKPLTIKLAEACENRTHQRQDRCRSTGFEVQAAHQDRSASGVVPIPSPFHILPQ